MILVRPPPLKEKGFSSYNPGMWMIIRMMGLSPFACFLASEPVVDSYDLSSMRAIGFGGYGMTETGGLGFESRSTRKKLGSVGIAACNLECMIVDVTTKEPMGPNQEGEIYLRGPFIFKEYLNNPEATSREKTEEGWLKTGDIGRFDDDFNLFIVDRIKDVIKLKDGITLYPGQLEEILHTHPAVFQCCVVGKVTGLFEKPVGYVILKPDVHVSEQELHDELALKLSAYKTLTGGIRFVEKLPLLPNGKFDKTQLKKELAAELLI